MTRPHTSQDIATTTLIRFAGPEDPWDSPTYVTVPRTPRSTARTYTEQAPSRIEKRRQRTRTFAEDPFRARFGQRLPRGMREEARGMEWKNFIRTYAPGSIRVDFFHAQRRTAGRFDYTIGMSGLRADGNATKVDITGMGACSVVSEVLADHGFATEILEFHQYSIFEATVTFIYATHKMQRVWAVGFGADRDLSIASALCNAASRLHIQ